MAITLSQPAARSTAAPGAKRPGVAAVAQPIKSPDVVTPRRLDYCHIHMAPAEHGSPVRQAEDGTAPVQAYRFSVGVQKGASADSVIATEFVIAQDAAVGKQTHRRIGGQHFSYPGRAARGRGR